MEQDRTWERQLIEKLATASLTEQRRARRWKIFFRLTWLAVLAGFVGLMFVDMESRNNSKAMGQPHTAVVSLDGAIDSESNVTAKMLDGLNAAYEDSNTRGIIIRANSPGGSPALSGMANDEILRLKKLHPKVPVYMVVEEVCASGCYYIAAAADRIYVDKASIVGSIGVISDGFGFDKAMDKLGIERRLATAGSNKGMGDPFSPKNPQQEAIRQGLLDEIHGQFIAVVKQGRGKRLADDPDLFSGRVWLGSSSIKLGLADGLGSVGSVARDVIKAEELVDFTPDDDLASRVARRIGVSFSGGVRAMLGDTRLH
ncbi:S49 family peptidase [Vogesella sp. DC21W]|uniref:S49 family peptidase n=1 Tax=Vogesella aquatica TaxID=2984206 RepID=A0ABT5IYL5_9NEIS|nr:S49 family peptidase [Vogesella aquatica]MDC7717668.1 S49 family peptidase [Vogesella aquatica]